MSPPHTAPLLSIITASRGRHDLLLRKATALKDQTLDPASFEWCLWLNEEPIEVERLRSALAAVQLPFAWRLQGGERLPVGRARNLAAQSAIGTTLLLSDDDCLPDETALEAHLHFQRMHSNSVGIGPLRLPAEMRKGRRLEPFERIAALGSRASWINFTGANSSLPSEAFWRVGGYDPQWSGYGGEDPELALRLRSYGMRFRHLPAGSAVHEGRVWDDEEKAYQAGRAHWRVVERHRTGSWELGIHPCLLAAKSVVLGGPWSALFDPDVLRYERAYARGARDAARKTAGVEGQEGSQE